MGDGQFVECFGPARDLQRDCVNGWKIRGCFIASSVCCSPSQMVCCLAAGPQDNNEELHAAMGRCMWEHEECTTRVGRGVIGGGEMRKSHQAQSEIGHGR